MLGLNKGPSIPFPMQFGGLVLWLDGQDPNANGVIPANNTPIITWKDKSGLNNHANAVIAPIFTNNAIRGCNALNFNGTTTSLTIPPYPSLAIAGDLTIFAAVQVSNYSIFRAILSKTNATRQNYPNSFDYYYAVTTGQPTLYRGNGTTIANYGPSIFPGANDMHLMCVTQSGTTVTHTIDATSATGSLSVSQADGGQPLYVGSRADGDSMFAGYYGEVLLFNRAFNSSDKTIFMKWLSQRWGGNL